MQEQAQTQRTDGWWREAYEFLAALYPQHQRSDAVLSAYEVALSGCDKQALRAVVAQAPRRWPRWFPSAGELLEAAAGVASKRAAAATSRPEPEPYEAPELPETNRYEQLARAWESKPPGKGEASKLLAEVATAMAPPKPQTTKTKAPKPGPWTLVLGPTPSLNEVKRHAHAGQHWWHKKLRDGWEGEAYGQRMEAGYKGPMGKMRVTLTRQHEGRQKEFDQDNLVGGAKGLIDALVSAGWLLGDTPAHVVVEYRQELGPSRTVVVLEELTA